MSDLYVEALNDMLFFDFGKAFAGHFAVKTCHEFYNLEYEVPITKVDEEFRGSNADVDLTLMVDIIDEEFCHAQVDVNLKVLKECRVEFELRGTDSESFHILPGFLFGDNNYANSGGNHFPNLRERFRVDDPDTFFPTWCCRADRLTAPVAMAFGKKNGFVALSGAPYHADADGNITRAGFGAKLPAATMYSLGYVNYPSTFVNKDTFTEPQKETLQPGAEMRFTLDLYMGMKVSRHTAFAVLRKVYDAYHESPESNLSVEECVPALADVLCEDGWNGYTQTFVSINVDGLPFEERHEKVGGRALAWVGGVNVAYPLLLAGCRFDNEEWINTAATAFEKVAGCWNEKSGMFFDALDEQGNPTVNYWWSENTNKDLHSAYTGAQIVYYLLKAAETIEAKGFEVPAHWVDYALRTLDTIVKLQHENGNLGYAYYPDRMEVADWHGFAGVWWVAALCLGYRRAQKPEYLDSAMRGAKIYYTQLQTLDVWGTPMDTYKANDEEGNLGFMRGVRLLHEITEHSDYLNMLGFSVEYECLWRYCYNTYPLEPPLRGSGWHSCGGSVTSVSNPHIHPMALFVSSDIKYLYDVTGDPYHQMRLEDGIIWAKNALEIYPEPAGYGRFGWTGERYCPSDGLLIRTFFDGSPASTDLALNLWAVAAILEGFLDVGEV